MDKCFARKLKIKVQSPKELKCKDISKKDTTVEGEKTNEVVEGSMLENRVVNVDGDVFYMTSDTIECK